MSPTKKQRKHNTPVINIDASDFDADWTKRTCDVLRKDGSGFCETVEELAEAMGQQVKDIEHLPVAFWLRRNQEMKDAIQIQRAIDDYAKAYRQIQYWQEKKPPLIPPGDQKTGCIGEFYAYLYLKDKHPQANLVFGTHSEKGWDVELSIPGKKALKLQIKTVSEYSKTRTISPIHHGWDELLLIYLDKSFSPRGFWIIRDNSLVKKAKSLLNKKCPHPERSGTGSKDIPFGANLVDELRASIARFISAKNDKTISALQAALKSLSTNRRRSEEHLHPLVTRLPAATKRRSLSRKQQLEVYKRNHFHCRYCGRATVLHATLEYVSIQFPNILPYHPNWKRSETHPLFPDITATCDHVVPISRGGMHDKSNLVTACARCQYMKSDWLIEELGWETREPADPNWDGLTVLFLEAYRCQPVTGTNTAKWTQELGR